MALGQPVVTVALGSTLATIILGKDVALAEGLVKAEPTLLARRTTARAGGRGRDPL